MRFLVVRHGSKSSLIFWCSKLSARWPNSRLMSHSLMLDHWAGEAHILGERKQMPGARPTNARFPPAKAHNMICITEAADGMLLLLFMITS